MNDWFERKQQQIANRAGDEELRRQLRAQIVSTAPYFWDEVVKTLETNRDKWNQARGRNEMFIHQASGPPDTRSLIVQGKDAQVSLQFDTQVPNISYIVGASNATGLFEFVFEANEVYVKEKNKRESIALSAKALAGFFLDLVVH